MISVRYDVTIDTPVVILTFKVDDGSCDVLHRMSVNEAGYLAQALHRIAVSLAARTEEVYTERLQRKLPFEEVPDVR
jgi:hypothetical protein